MGDALPFTRMLLTTLLLAAAAQPAFAEPPARGWKLQSTALGKLDGPARTRREPVIGHHLADDERAAAPAWALPFGGLKALGIGAEDRDRRGLSFSIRKSHGLKGMARLRF